MPFELGALNPNPGGTGHFMGEGGIEGAAKRGLERRRREEQEAKLAGASETPAHIPKDSISDASTAIEKKDTRTTTSSKEVRSPQSSDKASSGQCRRSWQGIKAKIHGKGSEA
jgi:hypothetical protein